MKAIVWTIGANGFGIELVRTFLLEYFADEIAEARKLNDQMSHRFGSPRLPTLSPSGPYDLNLHHWVKQFQVSFNALNKKKRKLPETGEVDFQTRAIMGIDEEWADDDEIKLPDGVKAVQFALTASELDAAGASGRFTGRAYRVKDLDKLLLDLGLKGARAGTVSDRRIAWLDEWLLVPKGHALYRAAEGKSECASLVQSLGVSNTKYWRRGPRVEDVETLEPGTVIATLGSGVYLSDYSGKSHVGIFLRKTKLGLVMLDQFNGPKGALGIRYKKFGAEHKRKYNPSRYFVRKVSHRMAVTGKDGETRYARDWSYDTVRHAENLTGDGSEYYVLLDDGNVARKESTEHRLRDDRKAVKQFVAELFDGIDFMGPKDAGAKLRKALKDEKPHSPQPGALVEPK